MGDMIAEERVDSGAFAPVVRTRLLERLAALLPIQFRL